LIWLSWLGVLQNDPHPERAADYVWYVAVTEWVTLAQPHLYLEIERDVRNGDIAYHLTRPVSYLKLKLASTFATALLGMAILFIPGTVASYLLTGGLPRDLRVLMSCTLILQFGILIGLCAFWLQDCGPVYWIWQKLLFVLGGLLVPLEVYPAWLRNFALWTPFSAAIHGPASMVFASDLSSAAGVAAKLVFWNGVLALLLAWVYRRALREIDLHGG
jgi:ABC-2 type transport system permease protein